MRSRRSLGMLVALVILWSAGLGTWSCFHRARAPGGPVLLARAGYVGVVFPRGSVLCGEPTAWGPAASDIERAEERILEFLRSKHPSLAGRLEEYLRQYFGVVRGGRRLIFCGFFHRVAVTKGWSYGRGDLVLRRMATPATAANGPASFFKLLYDPQADCCSECDGGVDWPSLDALAAPPQWSPIDQAIAAIEAGGGRVFSPARGPTVGSVDVVLSFYAQWPDSLLANAAALPRVRSLNLSRSAVSDAGLAAVQGMSGLEELGLSRTQVGDAGLAHLVGLRNLRVLDLQQTRVSDAGVKRLEQALPRCAIER